jgi:hypothetical protein
MTRATVLLLFLTSCTAVKISSSWTAPTAGTGAFKKIMAVSILRGRDTAMQRIMEHHLVTGLKTLGYDAVSYRDVFANGELRNMRYDTLRQKLTERGIDGVITIDLLDTEKETIYVKDKASVRPDNTPMGNFWESAAMVRQDPGKPGFFVSATNYFWQSSFYDVRTLALLYNARSTVFEVSSIETLASQYGKKIVEDMQKNYVLSSRSRFGARTQ